MVANEDFPFKVAPMPSIVERVRYRLSYQWDLLRLGKTGLKEKYEMAYWAEQKAKQQTLANDHYEPYYTRLFGLDRGFYVGKKLLDIGCGPRGSLEWADMTAERVGLDPLVDRYRDLGIDQHAMTYVNAGAEAMPFDDAHFDVVASMNSIDHVEDLDRTIAEIKRVLQPGGTFLLCTDIHDEPTICEPQTFSWEVVERFAPEMEVVQEEHLQVVEERMDATLAARIPYDEAAKHDQTKHGFLVARFVKH